MSETINNEVIDELVENEEVIPSEITDDECGNLLNVLAPVLVIGGVIVTAGVVAYKKHKAKIDGKPKKKRSHWKIVKVEDSDDIDSNENTVDYEAKEIVDSEEESEDK